MKKMISRIALTVVCLWAVQGNVLAAELLIPGGQIVGLQLCRDTVTVAAFDDKLGGAGKSAGLQVGDEILSVNGREVSTAEDVRRVLDRSDGTVELRVSRGGKEKKLKLTPTITDQGPRLGVYLRDGITGIGTVSWYDPDTGKFGTLGHGVSDSGGKLLDMTKGSAYCADVVTVKKGVAGEPGQLKGAVSAAGQIGELYRNTQQGVFGTSAAGWKGEPLPVGEAEDIRTGDAVIRSTVSGRDVREYSVEILKIYPNAQSSGRNMLLRVTDPTLLETTGGIVQGMGVSYNKDNQWNP